ncbi:hypothetical protein [Haloarcula halophila]|uniref:hypothetical protein n=1 Tax=Haloarcula TaxID=2237 RepID=UPI0023E39CEA|nr:hypothetical protein [Halomicroarcula sp. DFY41]
MVDGEEFISVNGTNVRLDIVGLVMSLVSGFILAVQTGIVSFINVVGDAIVTNYNAVSSFVVDLIDALFPTSTFRIATDAAIQTVQNSGILGFIVGAIAVALLLFVVSEVVQL